MAGDAQRKGGFTPYALLAPGVLWLILFFMVPVWFLLQTALSKADASGDTSFVWKWSNFSDSWTLYQHQYLLSFRYALIATLLCIIIGYPLAYVIAFRGGRYRNLLLGLVVVPFFTSYLVRTLAWKTILQDQGPFVGFLRNINLVSENGRVLSTSWAAGRTGGWYAPRWLRRAGNWLLNGWAVMAYVYLFAPIIIIVLFSFNNLNGINHPFNYTWEGFTFSNWAHPFGRFPELGRALVQSVKIALLASLIATAMGTLIAIALSRYRFRGGALINLLLVLPLTTPEICLGSSLLTLFLTRGVALGFITILIAHIMFCVSFVALTVKARIRGFDWTLEDAAMDLGATPFRTFRKVTMPLIMPGVIAAFMLSFSLSIDDYIITVFNAGNTVTFPIQIFTEQKIAVPPQIDVLASMILFVSIALIGGGTAFRLMRENRLRSS